MKSNYKTIKHGLKFLAVKPIIGLKLFNVLWKIIEVLKTNSCFS